MLLLDGVQYCLSIHWFRKARYEGKSPQYYKMNGKVYYTVENVDKWFKENLKAV
jgi:hypothetical protein